MLKILLFNAVFGTWLLSHHHVVDASALRSDRRHRASQGRSDPDRPYFWMCPEVLCPPISEDCETVEYIVFQYDYQVRGRTINVRCESCEYCLDGPFPKNNRQRRSIDANPLAQHESTSCPRIHCPRLPGNCRDHRLTDVLVNGETCKRCPACYDATVLNGDV